jgi:hypothetical protein
MPDYDSPWKEALDIFVEAFLKLFFPEAHADIDWGRPYESLDKEFQRIAPEAEIGRRYVDKLVKVWLKSGEEQWVLIHIEVQMTDDADFPWRMYVYNCRIFVMYSREVASFAVLGDDNPTWRPSRFGYRRWGVKLELEYPVVKLLDYAAKRHELEQSSNPFATVVLAHLDAQETRQDLGQRKDRKFRLVKGLLERGWEAQRVRQLFRLIDWLMELPKDFKVEFNAQITAYNKEKHMAFVSTFEEIAQLNAIETVLEARFPGASSQLMSEIRQVVDAQHLTKVLRAAVTVAGPDELRKQWANGSDNGPAQ